MSTLVNLQQLFPGISCEQLFELLSTPRHMEQWFSPDDSIPVHVLHHCFIVDGEYRLRYTQPDGAQLFVRGRFLQIEFPSLISFTWVWEEGDVHAGVPTQVTWLLKPHARGCELTVIHERTPDADYADRHREGWRGALQRLAILCNHFGDPHR